MRFIAGVARIVFAVSLAMLLSGCVTQHHRIKDALHRDPSRPPTILVLPVDAELAELSLGGFPTPRQDWTVAAREHMNAALRGAFSERTIAAVFRDEVAHDDETAAKILRLHAAVGHSIMHHQYEGPNRLPTKAKGFEWTLGPSARMLAGDAAADYMLAIYVRDSYSGPGRVIAQVVVAALFGVAMQGGMQVGFASLVDLRTGEVVWFNRLIRGGGDLRTAAPARETIDTLLTGLPK